LPDAVAKAVTEGDLVAFRCHFGQPAISRAGCIPRLRANYLASPMLVVAYALAGSINMDLTKETVGYDKENEPVYLKDIWPTPRKSRVPSARR